MTVSQDLVARIKSDFNEGRLPLPSLPVAARSVREAVGDEANGPAEIARVLEEDNGLTVRVIQMANSGRYAEMSPVESCQDAVSRLGLKAVRDVVVALTLRELFDGSSPGVAERLNALWQHSVRVAAISQVLGGIGPDLDGDRAMLAGLVHDIGILPLLTYAEEYPAILESPALLKSLIERLRGRLGSLILREWGFDEDLTRVPVEAENWERDPSPMPDYADVVLLANVFSLFGSMGTYPGPPLHTLPAFSKFPLGALGPEGGVELLEEARDQIDEVMGLLQG